MYQWPLIDATDSSGIDLIKPNFIKKSAIIRLLKLLFRQTFVGRIPSLDIHIFNCSSLSGL